MITIFIICDYNDVPQPRHRTVDTHCCVQLLWVQCKHEVIILIIVWHMDCITALQHLQSREHTISALHVKNPAVSNTSGAHYLGLNSPVLVALLLAACFVTAATRGRDTAHWFRVPLQLSSE